MSQVINLSLQPATVDAIADLFQAAGNIGKHGAAWDDLRQAVSKFNEDQRQQQEAEKERAIQDGIDRALALKSQPA